MPWPRTIIESKLLGQSPLLLWSLLAWRGPRRDSSQRCLLALEIGSSPLALGLYTMLLSHAMSID